jgi:hypothetical protein
MLGSVQAYPQLVGWIITKLQAKGLTGITLTNLSVPVVREVNVLFGLLTVFFVFLAARRLWGQSAGLWSAALFAFTGTVVFTAGFATYDMPSLALLAASVYFAIEGTEDHFVPIQLVLIILSGVSIAGSFFVKYINIAFLPALIAIIVIRKKWLGLVFSAATITIAAKFTADHWSGIQTLIAYKGGHGNSYGSTPQAILYEVFYFVGPLLILAISGVGSVKKNWVLALVLTLASLITPVYHLVFNDPLALMKQMSWAALFAVIPAGVAMARLKVNWMKLILFAVFVVYGTYQVRVLEQFYPDLTTVDAYLQQNVQSTDCNILVDDNWTVRWALNSIFDTKEYCVADQWTFKHDVSTPDSLITNIGKGVYPYIIYEQGGMFSGENANINSMVMQSVQTSGLYENVLTVRSKVTWGNAILPPEFEGTLTANSTVTILVWKRR